MAAAPEAFVHEDRPSRPHLRVVHGGAGRPDPRHARRRFTVLAVVAALAFAGGLIAASIGPRVMGDGPAGAGAPVRGAELTVVVAPGDTLWDIAREHLPEGTRPGDYVAEILDVNDLDPTALQPGTVVRLPPP